MFCNLLDLTDEVLTPRLNLAPKIPPEGGSGRLYAVIIFGERIVIIDLEYDHCAHQIVRVTWIVKRGKRQHVILSYSKLSSKSHNGIDKTLIELLEYVISTMQTVASR